MSQDSIKGEAECPPRSIFHNHRFAPYGVFAILWIAACVPVFLPSSLPLQDYPAHIARLYILHDGIANENIAAYFGVNWHFVANLALEIFTYPFVELFSPDIAGRIFICATFFLLTSGTIRIHRALGGTGYWPYLSFLFLYTDILLYGFIAFLFSCGLSLWVLALWLNMRQSSAKLRVIVFGFLSLLLLTSHLFAFCFYALMVGSYELSRLLDRKKKGDSLINSNFLVGILQFMPAILLFFIMSNTADAANIDILGSVKSKLSGMASLIALYNIKLQLGLIWVLGFMLYILRDKGMITTHKYTRIFLVFALIIFLASPVKAFASYYVDYRMPSVFVFAVIASIVTQKPTLKSSWFIGFLMTICLAHYSYIGSRWVAFEPFYDDLYEITEDLQGGDTLMHVTMSNLAVSKNLSSPYAHAPSLLTISKQIITPFIFAVPQHQPIYYKQGLYQYLQSDVIATIIPYQENGELKEEFEALNSKKYAKFKYLLLMKFDEDFMQESTIWQHQKTLGIYRLYKNTAYKNGGEGISD